MKLNIFLLLSLIIMTFSTCTTSKKMTDNVLSKSEKNNGWQMLFNGTSLDGWRMYKNKKTDSWGVKDGVIYCKESVDKSDLRSDIVTTAQYENFELSVDWKIAPQANSGIMYHVTEEFDAPYLSGPEYQLIDDKGFPQKLEEWQMTASDYAMHNASSRPTKPIGEFNTSKIVVNGTKREHWLNGVKVLSFDAMTPEWFAKKSKSKWSEANGYGMAKKGHICLQDHGGGVWFKNIKLKELK